MYGFLKDKERWERIRTNKEYKPLLDYLLNKFSEFDNQPIPEIPFSLVVESLKKGERFEVEQLYKKRRIMMNTYLLMTLIYPENDSCLHRLEDIIAVILEEYSWCIPAHLPVEQPNTPCHLDLYSTETGFHIAEIKYVLSDRLSPILTERMTKELKRRIIDSFRNNKYWFEDLKSNWAAVCGGSIGSMLLYEDMDTYMEFKPRIERCMSNYLESLGEDGSTSEGAGYMEYGMSNYLLWADLLNRRTMGRIDRIKKRSKVVNSAKFVSDTAMTRSIKYSFSDNGQELGYGVWFINYLKETVNPELPLWFGEIGISEKTSLALRSFYYYQPITEERLVNKTAYYEKLGAAIIRKDMYSLGIKGGFNKEEHNHNDVGSFALAANDKMLLCDLGAPLYTMNAFSAESFETLIEKSSFGHNVPIIEGEAQGYGEEYRGEMAVNGDTVTIDFPKAYKKKISKLLRTIITQEDKLCLKDEFEKGINWQERFVSVIEPKLTKGMVKIDCLNICFDGELFNGEVETVITKTHTNQDKKVYLITLTPNKDLDTADITMTFDEGTTRDGN